MVKTLFKEGQELKIGLPQEDRLEQVRAHVKQFLIGCGVAETEKQIAIYTTYSNPTITYQLVTGVESLVRVRAEINGSHDVVFEVIEITEEHCRLKIVKI
jgi:hypothetical protein